MRFVGQLTDTPVKTIHHDGDFHSLLLRQASRVSPESVGLLFIRQPQTIPPSAPRPTRTLCEVPDCSHCSASTSNAAPHTPCCSAPRNCQGRCRSFCGSPDHQFVHCEVSSTHARSKKASNTER